MVIDALNKRHVVVSCVDWNSDPGPLTMPLNTIHFQFEPFEDDAYGIIAVVGDVQVGWCRRQQGGWSLFDMDEELLGGPFSDLQAAETACSPLLAHMAGASNPGH